MAKNEEAPKTRKIVCIHTINAPDELGEVKSNRPGTIIEVDAAEAERLVGLNAASYPDLDDEETAAKVEAAAKTDAGTKDESPEAGKPAAKPAGNKK